ncbi:hypothetical protein BIZ37_24515 [Photobacterium sp. BZF1]|uniref:hypothetical protein n=1 Tax=Photobacterium sp. BZF1 TaxID=1904457 RepID=UPI001653B7AC|nr:hypothetical protein [Photobacterium sp. BZF1]MBC7005727.1 hypothetical protein [Photobacterium sp. BZF1]
MAVTLKQSILEKTTMPFRLVGMEWLNAQTMSLKLQPEQPYSYQAGQYLTLPLPSSQKALPFSIASGSSKERSNQNNDYIEIQIGGVLPDSELAGDIRQFRTQWLNQQPLYLGQAAGEAYFRDTGSAVTIVAGGSGFSYAKSIVYEALSLPKAVDITLYWGAKTVADLYEHNAMVALANQHPHFHYVAVVETLPQDSSCHCDAIGLHQGQLLDIFFFNQQLGTNQDMYICGRFEMVQTAYRHIVKANPELAGRIFSDALPPIHKR